MSPSAHEHFNDSPFRCTRTTTWHVCFMTGTWPLVTWLDLLSHDLLVDFLYRESSFITPTTCGEVYNGDGSDRKHFIKVISTFPHTRTHTQLTASYTTHQRLLIKTLMLQTSGNWNALCVCVCFRHPPVKPWQKNNTSFLTAVFSNSWFKLNDCEVTSTMTGTTDLPPTLTSTVTLH